MTWEFAFLDWMQSWHNPVLNAIMCFFTMIGNGGIFWIAVCVVLLIIPKTRKAGVIMMFSLLVEFILCNLCIKPLVNRARPCDINTAVQLLMPRPSDASFPSGHTGFAFASVAALYFAKTKYLWKILLPVAIMIALSKMYLYHHFPTDIIAGFVVGIISAMIGYMIYRWLARKISKKQIK